MKVTEICIIEMTIQMCKPKYQHDRIKFFFLSLTLNTVQVYFQTGTKLRILNSIQLLEEFAEWAFEVFVSFYFQSYRCRLC